MAENSPFVWGAGGEQLTPAQIASRRQVAQAMMAQAGDYSPIKSAWQGAARVAQGVMGGLDAKEADRAESANAAAERQLIEAMLGRSSPGGAPVAAAGAPVAPPATAAGKSLPALDAPAAPVSRPMVLPSARVWGDKEAENAGLYEPSGGPAAKPAAVPAVAAPAPAPAAAAPAAAVASPGVATVAGAMNPAIVQASTSPYVSEGTRSLGRTMLAEAMKPRARFTQETDANGNIWSVNGLTGERSVALKREKEEEPGRPMNPDERKLYGIPDGVAVMMTSKGPKAIGTGGVTVNNNSGGGSDKQIFDALDERAKLANAAATGLVGLRNARAALEGPGGAITGAGADTKLLLTKVGAAFGITDPKAAENTEVFKAAIAPQVAAMLKATVGTANISNSDREFAEKAAGGNITLDAGSIKRLLDIMERGAIAQIERHQKQLDAVYPDPEKHQRERALFGVSMPEVPAVVTPPVVAAAPGTVRRYNPATGRLE